MDGGGIGATLWPPVRRTDSGYRLGTVGSERISNSSVKMDSDGTGGVGRPSQAGVDGDGGAADTRETRLQELADRLHEFEVERASAAEAGDQVAEAHALRRMGDLQRAAGVDDAARDSYAKARSLLQLTGNAEGEAAILAALGSLEARLRRYDQAARHYRDAREIYQRIADPLQEAEVLLSEADVLLSQGKPAAAVQRIEAASTLYGGVDGTLGQAHAAFRLGMMALAEDPQAADEHLELASRLFGDHVGRDVPDADTPLPATVSDSRRFTPYVMQRVCLRERQKLAGGGSIAARSHRHSSGSSLRKTRRAAVQTASAAESGLPIWIGAAAVVVVGAALLLPQLVADTTLFALVADAFGDSVTPGDLVHVGVGAFGAVVAIVAAQQLGISAPVVLLAMAIGFGMIFHEVSRAVFPTVGGRPANPEATVTGDMAHAEAQRLQEGRSQSAKLVVDARTARARGDLPTARSLLSESLSTARSNNDTAGQLRALEEMFGLESEHGELSEQLAVAEQLYEVARGFDESRSRTLLEAVVALAAQLGDLARLRQAQTNLLLLHERAGDTEAAVATLLALAALDRDAHHLESAYEWFNRAHGAYQSLRDQVGQIDTLAAMGEIDARLGRRRRAYGHYYHAFVMYREADDKAGQAAMLLHMGSLDEASENYEEAIAAFRQSQRLFNGVGDKAGEALAALRFAIVQLAHGSQRQARDGFRRSLDLFADLGDVAGQARASLGLGQYYVKFGQPDTADEHYASARALYRNAGDPRGELAVLREMVLLAHARVGGAAAQGKLAEVRRLARSVADPGVRAGVLLSAGDLALAVDNAAEAESIYRESLALYETLGDDAGQRVASERLTRLPAAAGAG